MHEVPASKLDARALEARHLARIKGADRRRRVSILRRRVLLGSVAVFLGTWVLIFGQLTAGHDPALAHKTQVKQSRSSSGLSATSGSDTEASSTAADGSSSGDDSASGSSGASPTPVTTQQS